MRDHRDLVIEQLGDERLEAQELAVQYRQLAHAAIDGFCTLSQERDRLRQQHDRLLDEYRALIARTMRQAVAA